MKLNPSSVRSVLLAIEDLSDTDDNDMAKIVSIQNLLDHPLIHDMDWKELVYVLRKLKDGNYIIANFIYSGNILYTVKIKELTFTGHQFLDTIRSSRVFDSVMTKLDEFGSSVTLDIIKSLATKVLKDKLGL